MNPFEGWPKVRLSADDYAIEAMRFRELMAECLKHKDMRGYHRAWAKSKRWEKTSRRILWAACANPRTQTKEAA